LTNKKILWKIHAWLGLYVGVMILLFSITGSIIVFRQEIDQMLNPDLFKVSSIKKDIISLDRISQNILLEHPSYYLHHYKFIEKDKVFEVKIKPGKIEHDKNGDLDIFVDPISGNINGERSNDSGILYWVTKLHTNLLAGKVGRFIVGTFGIALLIMLVVGLMIYRNFTKKKKFYQIRWGEGSRKISADWHKLIGLTSVPFNLIWAITGITLAFLPSILESTVGKPDETFAKPKLLTHSIRVEPFTYDNIFKIVLINFPEAEIKTIREKTKDSPFIEVKLDFHNPLISDDVSKLYIDKEKQEIISHFDARSASFGSQLFYSQQPLHFGTYGGLWSKIIYSVFGLSSGILFITGFLIWRVRNKKIKNYPAS
jgi:uncharacterized iron-regulated membrane protein